MTKLEGDNRLNFGKNSVFMKPEEELIELDCSKYENIGPSSEDENTSKGTDFDDF